MAFHILAMVTATTLHIHLIQILPRHADTTTENVSYSPDARCPQPPPTYGHNLTSHAQADRRPRTYAGVLATDCVGRKNRTVFGDDRVEPAQHSGLSHPR